MMTEEEEVFFNNFATQKKELLQKQCEKDAGKAYQSDTGKPCRKCKLRNVRFIIYQSRSGDEGSGALYVCKNCKHQWHEK